jgi:phospholipase/carboxylesterase
MSASPLPAFVIEATGSHRSSIIWLHGLGADGHDFASIAAELALPAALGVRFILPHAPKIPVTINHGLIMRAWYDIRSTDLVRTPDADGIQDSTQAIERLIDDELARGIAPERIILAGFSQGGVIAIQTGTQHIEKVGGVVALSCYLGIPEALPPASRSLPVFVAHGTEDAIVPVQRGRDAAVTLEKKGYAVCWRDYPMGHSVCLEEIDDIRTWLLSRLAGGR